MTLEEMTEELAWCYSHQSVIGRIIEIRAVHVSEANKQQALKRLRNPWTCVGYARWRRMSYADKLDRQWYEIQVCKKGVWRLAVCSPEADRIAKLLSYSSTMRPRRLARFLDRKFYSKARKQHVKEAARKPHQESGRSTLGKRNKAIGRKRHQAV